jgi:hypothetical protein
VRLEAEGRRQSELERARQEAEAAARTLEAESIRLQQEAEARLEAELNRVRQEANAARLADKADTERIRAEAAAEARAVAEATLARETERARAEANARLKREVAEARADAERRRGAELEEMRAQVARLRDAAAEQARSAAAKAVAVEVAKAKTASAPEAPPQEQPVFTAQSSRPPRRFPRWIIPVAACLAVMTVGGYTLGSGPARLAFEAATGWLQGSRKAGPPVAPTESEAPKPAATPGPAKPAAKKPAPAPATGSMTITSPEPGATVTVDGQARGKTPLELNDIPVGTHIVVVQGPEGSVTRTVNVKPGARATVSAAAEPGFLIIASRIPLEIFVGSKRIGSSEDDKIALPPGSHRLTLINRTKAFRSELTVEIKSGEMAAYTATLPTGGLKVTTAAGAEVFVDGRSVGVAPLGVLELPAGGREILVRHPELGEKRVTVEIQRDQEQGITLPLGTPTQPDASRPSPPRLAPLSAPPAPRPTK